MSVDTVASLPEADQAIQVELFYAASAQDCLHRHLALPVGATLWHALQAAGLAERLALDLTACRKTGHAAGLAMSIWGRLCSVDAPLHRGDRVELTRPLQVDPKEARRLRYRRDGHKKKIAPRRP